MSDKPRTLKDLIGDPMKPREFWITESRCTGKQKAHKTQLECWGEIQHNDNEYHVIEYAFYEKLKAENERLNQDLSKSRSFREDTEAKLAEVEAEVEKWKGLENFTGCTFSEIFGQAGKLKKGAYAAKPRPLIFCDCNEPENKKIHDEICDILEENAWNEDAVCTASAAIWMTLKYFEREREAAKVMREALEFYAREDFYEYDKTQGINYMWNDQGHKARQALAKADEIRGGE